MVRYYDAYSRIVEQCGLDPYVLTHYCLRT